MRVRVGVFACAAFAVCAACQPQTMQPQASDGLAVGSRPNVLLIVADDLGYLDLGAYGSEIETPNIDALAASGLILTNYYTAPMCAPTRAMLLSGTDNHRAGLGAQRVGGPDALPGYEGYLNDRVVSVSTRLQSAGYHTYMAGKWHLGLEEEQGPAARGFERSFVLLDGGASHFGDMVGYTPAGPARYRDDGPMVESLPEDFYSTIAYTDRMIDYIDANAEDGQPFFGYLAYTAPHWPTHALEEDMARTEGRYDDGYDVLREERFARWKDLGFGPADAELAALPTDYVPWDDLSAEQKAVRVRTMEAYAAMVERMDAEIGRLLDHLDAIGERDDTLVIFVADNGAEGTEVGFLEEYRATFDNSVENIGRPNSYAMIGAGWAAAGDAQYWLRKTFTAEGGIHVPAIINGPALGVPAGRSDAIVAVHDLAPTFLELAGASETVPAPPGAEPFHPITGRSFAGLLRGEVAMTRADTEVLAFELHGHRAIRRGDWKATWVQPPQGPGRWQLFNLVEDPAERHDLATEQPALLAELADAWDAYADEYGVDVIE